MLKDKSLLEDSDLVKELDCKVVEMISGGSQEVGTSPFSNLALPIT